MKWIVFIALASLSPLSKGVPLVAGSNERESRIMGGKLASEGEFPFIVTILRRGNDLHCAGTIIDKEWVLTAAHCIVSCPMKDMKIRSGSSKWNHGGTLHKVFMMMPHPEFGTTDSGVPFNDIGLLKVSPPFIKGNKTVDPVPLAKKDNKTRIGYNATVAGWGLITPRGPFSQRLLKARIPILHQKYCKYHHSIPENQMCAGRIKGKVDSCQGDSGGPLLINGTQHGIVSWGYGCANPYFPGLYTEVAAYRSWIRKYSGV